MCPPFPPPRALPRPALPQSLRIMKAQMDALVLEAATKGARLDELEEELVGVSFPNWLQPKPKMPVCMRCAVFVSVNPNPA